MNADLNKTACLVATERSLICLVAVSLLSLVHETATLAYSSASPEVLEEKSYAESSGQTYGLSKKQFGNKTLTLYLSASGLPQLRFLNTLKPIANISEEEAEALFGEKAVSDLITSTLFGWNGTSHEKFRVVAKIENGILKSYKLTGNGIKKIDFQEIPVEEPK